MESAADRRFAGVTRLLGVEARQRLQNASVCVAGVGGVGSWTVEALVRSAVGRLTIIDMDHVAESNMNRQLTALEPHLGRAKIDVLVDRATQINPACVLTPVDACVTVDNVAELVSVEHDWVIDCIDSFRIKAAMIAFCRRRGQSLITVGGAGGQVDPTRIRISDLRRTEQDPLLARTRRLLRQDYGFPSNPKRRFGVPCVWSDEPQAAPPTACGPTDSSLNCGGLGSCMPVTATYGLVAAAYVMQRIANGPGGPVQSSASPP